MAGNGGENGPKQGLQTLKVVCGEQLAYGSVLRQPPGRVRQQDQQQALAKALGEGQEAVPALFDQTLDQGDLVNVVVPLLADQPEGLDADGRLVLGGGVRGSVHDRTLALCAGGVKNDRAKNDESAHCNELRYACIEKPVQRISARRNLT